MLINQLGYVECVLRRAAHGERNQSTFPLLKTVHRHHRQPSYPLVISAVKARQSWMRRFDTWAEWEGRPRRRITVFGVMV
jgi:hypothetical protein